MLRIAYGCGLRVSEVLHLRAQDIDSARHILWARHGKGGKDRHYGLLSNRQREDKLTVCRLLLFVAGLWLIGPMASPQPRPSLCPVCGGELWVIVERFGPMIGEGMMRVVRVDSS